MNTQKLSYGAMALGSTRIASAAKRVCSMKPVAADINFLLRPSNRAVLANERDILKIAGISWQLTKLASKESGCIRDRDCFDYYWKNLRRVRSFTTVNRALQYSFYGIFYRLQLSVSPLLDQEEWTWTGEHPARCRGGDS